MLRYKKLHLILLLALLAFSSSAGNSSTILSANDSAKTVVSQDETILFNMINDMRRQNKLPSIPLSLDLCKVAQTHIADLIKWKPQEKGCSLHSWSGSGKWTSCCNTKEVFGIKCMKSKPREITGYPGDGYELIYWGEDMALPAEAIDLWKQVEASSDMILSRAKWSGYQWKTMGVGIKEGYAILWLGDAEDLKSETATAVKSPVAQPVAAKMTTSEKSAERENTMSNLPVKQKETTVPVKNVQPITGESGTLFHVIVGSMKTAESAEAELKKVKSKGYPNAYIIEGDSLYRIAIASFNSSAKATVQKNELKETFPGIWILKK